MVSKFDADRLNLGFATESADVEIQVKLVGQGLALHPHLASRTSCIGCSKQRFDHQMISCWLSFCAFPNASGASN